MIDRIHGGNVKGEGLIDFSISINPLGPPPGLKNIITKNLDSLACYPQPDSKRLKSALGHFHGIGPENLLVANGSIELIYLIPQVLRPKKVLITIPTFSEYEFAAKAVGAKIFFAKPMSDVEMIFLCNPNNPTGTLLRRNEILSLSKAKYKATLVIDEAFIDFVKDSGKITMLYEAVKNRNLLVLRSLTKFFAIPGLRLGYMVGHKDIINRLSGLQYPWNVNILAQVAGIEILKEKDYIQRSKEFVSKEKEFLFNNLNNIQGLKAYPPSSNFIFCKLKNRNAGLLYRRLLKKGIIIRKCSNFRGLDNRFFRVAVRNRRDNLKLLKEVKTWLKKA